MTITHHFFIILNKLKLKHYNMPKSRNRGGEKSHRKRVVNRSKRIKQEVTAAQKIFNESMKQQLEELRKKYESESGTTENV